MSVGGKPKAVTRACASHGGSVSAPCHAQLEQMRVEQRCVVPSYFFANFVLVSVFFL